MSETVRTHKPESTHQEVEPKRKIEDRNDHIEFYLVLMFDRALILIHFQSEDRSDDDDDGKEKTECLFPKKLPCLLVGFEGPRIGMLAMCF